MNLIIFLFVTTLFLFFLGSYAMSPDHNPKVKEIADDAEAERIGKRVTRKHAVDDGTVKLGAALCNGSAILLSTGLICWVPFFRVVAAVAMVVYVVRFFYRRHTGGAVSNFVPVIHTPNWGSPNDGRNGRPGPDIKAGEERIAKRHASQSIEADQSDSYNGA